MQKNIIVFGATGKTGTQIIESLQSAQQNFFVFVRAQSLHKLSGENLSVVQGDVLNPESVMAAFQAHTFTDIIISLGSASLKQADIRSKGTQHIIEALQAHQGAATLHVVSALGVGESSSQLKWYNKLIVKFLLKSVMIDHEQQEDLIKASNLPFHIIRPVGLKEGPATGKVHVQAEGFLPKDGIQRADVAHYLVESMLEGKTGFSNICQGV